MRLRQPTPDRFSTTDGERKEMKNSKVATDDRRVFPRAPGVLDGNWFGNGQRCRVTSLSVVGCYVETLSPPEPGTRGRVQIELRQEGTVLVPAEVVYREHGMGFAVRFVDVEAECASRLAKAVEQLIGSN